MPLHLQDFPRYWGAFSPPFPVPGGKPVLLRPLRVAAFAAACIATPVTAQNWTAEFGMQSGYTRIKPAGTSASDHVDLFGVPTVNLPGFLPGNASLFAILPWKRQLAIETSLSAVQGDAIGLLGDATFFNVGLRADYAITPAVYAAAGGALNWIESGGQSETQLGIQAAVGYRFGFIAGLRGRVEANVLFLGKSELLNPVDAYALTFGVSRAVRRASPGATRRTDRAFTPAIGFQGGYSRSHAVGGFAGSFTTLSFPGAGGAFTPLGGAPAMPTIFAILPVGRKFALEPGADMLRIQTSGTTSFAGNLSLRANFAVSGGWYGALGGNLVYLKATGSSAETLTGANVAWGHRFHLTGDLGGRVELNYLMMAKNDNVGFPAVNTLGLQFGVTLPLR